MSTRCPHKNIRFCPLYHAAHTAGSFGCDDGNMDTNQQCAVSRNMDYQGAIEALRAACPGLVAGLEFSEMAEAAKEQRRRTMRLLGLH